MCDSHVLHCISLGLRWSRSLTESEGWLKCMILFIELNVDSERGLNRHWRGGDGMSGKDSHDVHVNHTHLSFSLQKLPVSLGPLPSLEW